MKRRRGAPIWLWLLLSSAAGPPVLAQPWKVATEVRTEAEVFRDNYDAAKLRAVETAAAAALAGDDGCGGIFNYLEWDPAGGAAGEGTGDTPDARLVLKVEQEDTFLGPKITLHYLAAVGDRQPAPLDAMLGPEDAVLYEGYETDFPSHDPAKLERDLTARIRHHCQAETIQGFLQDKVLAEIPLAEDVEFDVAGQKLSLPEPIRQLKASEDTRFKVELVATNAAGQDTRGEMIVAPQLPPPDYKAIIHFLFFDEVLVRQDDFRTWHPALASILPARKQLRVYMQHYDEDLGIGAGVATSLVPPQPAAIDF